MNRSRLSLDARTTVSDVLSCGGPASAVFIRRGMACPGCAMAPFMSLEEAAAAYGVATDLLLADLRAALHPAGEAR